MRGTSVSVVRPSASNAAAIVFRTLFFAPVTRTSPASRAPPTTRKSSGVVGPALNIGGVGRRRAARKGTWRHRRRGVATRPRRLDVMVNLTRIYTRTGDDGTTGYGGRGRIDKNDVRLVAYAECDEANSAIG